MPTTAAHDPSVVASSSSVSSNATDPCTATVLPRGNPDLRSTVASAVHGNSLSGALYRSAVSWLAVTSLGTWGIDPPFDHGATIAPPIESMFDIVGGLTLWTEARHKER